MVNLNKLLNDGVHNVDFQMDSDGSWGQMKNDLRQLHLWGWELKTTSICPDQVQNLSDIST